MLNNARKHEYAPEEIYSEKNKTADDGTLAKVLFFAIARQTSITRMQGSVDAANCYNSVAHVIVSLVFQSFAVSKEAVLLMPETIEEMKYFLRTVYGDFKNFRVVILGAHKRK